MVKMSSTNAIEIIMIISKLERERETERSVIQQVCSKIELNLCV